MLDNLRSRFERTAADRPVLVAFMVVVMAALVIVPISMPFYVDKSLNFWENIVAEAHGVLFDLIIIGWFLFWLNKVAERRIRNNRYEEEIEDFLGWNSAEATLRIVGNIRRLNRSEIVKGFHLAEAHLEDAKLGGVRMEESDLWGAHLDGANLRESTLDGSNLAGASLVAADLARASLVRCDLRGANLNEADLERGTLDSADLRGASLVGADLQYAKLYSTDLRRARLSGANLRAARLDHANLEGATLNGAHLRGASLRGACLIDVDMTGADLLSVSFVGADLPTDQEDLIGMFERAKSLFGAEFDTGVYQTLKEAIPDKFELRASTNGVAVDVDVSR